MEFELQLVKDGLEQQSSYEAGGSVHSSTF